MAEGHDLLGAVRNHYDQLSFFYRLFWGDHIHHGYWEDNEGPAEAQENLIARLAERAAVPRGGHVLDVGCGLGGSSFWLARHLGCSVQGITISPAQCAMAATRAREEGLAERVSFAVADANRLELPAESFDAVWVIECSEHLADKADFLRRAGRVLRPGGRLALCAWLANEGRDPDGLVAEVRRAMLCPSLASLGDYLRWMGAAGLADVRGEDVTRRVERTWDHCLAILEHPDVRDLLPHLDAATRDFLGVFGTMRRAYATGAMGYGMFTARRP